MKIIERWFWAFCVVAALAGLFVPGIEPTNIDTHTYIFVDDVIQQSSSATLAAGFPATWGGTAPDYGMDPDVIGPGDDFGGVYAATIRDDLRSIPSMSIVMRIDDMFGSNGIYTRSTSGGIAYERPASVELLIPAGPDGTADGGFQVDCGIEEIQLSHRDPDEYGGNQDHHPPHGRHDSLQRGSPGSGV